MDTIQKVCIKITENGYCLLVWVLLMLLYNAVHVCVCVCVRVLPEDM